MSKLERKGITLEEITLEEIKQVGYKMEISGECQMSESNGHEKRDHGSALLYQTFDISLWVGYLATVAPQSHDLGFL